MWASEYSYCEISPQMIYSCTHCSPSTCVELAWICLRRVITPTKKAFRKNLLLESDANEAENRVRTFH
jgi:hypothetical protein